jgi:hypothetical protein
MAAFSARRSARQHACLRFLIAHDPGANADHRATAGFDIGFDREV